MGVATLMVDDDEETSVSISFEKPDNDDDPVPENVVLISALAAALGNKKLMECIIENFYIATQEAGEES